MLRGGSCNLALGWYNADSSGARPSEIHRRVPGGSEAASCEDPDFCPLAPSSELPLHTWMPQSFSTGAIADHPRYTGRLVGFAMIGDPSAVCGRSKYSQPELNFESSFGAPWVPIHSDVVCPGGRRNGPSDAPGLVGVVVDDVYRLDRDGDGMAASAQTSEQVRVPDLVVRTGTEPSL